MVVGPKNTLFLDEISTGLDSSTTFLIVRCVRNFVHTLQARPCLNCKSTVWLQKLAYAAQSRPGSSLYAEQVSEYCQIGSLHV